MSDEVWTSSIAAAAASARAAVPPHSSAESSVSTGRTRFDGAKSVYAIDRSTGAVGCAVRRATNEALQHFVDAAW